MFFSMFSSASVLHNTSTFEVTCQRNHIPPFRFYKAHDNPFEVLIQSYPACRAPKTVVHVTTRSPVLVTHVLGTSWENQLVDSRSVLYTGVTESWSNLDEEQLAQRILQVGGAVLDTSYFHEEGFYEDRAKQFADFSRAKEFLFGWPADGGVWVLHLSGKVPYEYWEKPARQYYNEDGSLTMAAVEELEEEEAQAERYYLGLPEPVPDDAVDTRKLNEARTMDEYCIELKNLGAIYYDDIKASHEVKRAGVFSRDTLTVPWAGFIEWWNARNQSSGKSNLPTDQTPHQENPDTYNRCVVS